MEIRKFHNKIQDPQLAHLLDSILDAVLALKAYLTDSNMDSNSIGGTSFIRVARPKTKEPQGEQASGEREGELATC